MCFYNLGRHEGIKLIIDPPQGEPYCELSYVSSVAESTRILYHIWITSMV